jgi:hypothetical protein
VLVIESQTRRKRRACDGLGMSPILFASFAIIDPGLLGLTARPFLYIVLSAMLLVALGYAVVMGSIGGFIGRLFPMSRRTRPA